MKKLTAALFLVSCIVTSFSAFADEPAPSTACVGASVVVQTPSSDWSFAGESQVGSLQGVLAVTIGPNEAGVTVAKVGGLLAQNGQPYYLAQGGATLTLASNSPGGKSGTVQVNLEFASKPGTSDPHDCKGNPSQINVVLDNTLRSSGLSVIGPVVSYGSSVVYTYKLQQP